MRSKLSHFKFNLPEELIAQYPTEERDQSRLMVVDRQKGTIEHKVFKDILDYFDDGDVMIFNNTKVFPARLFGRKEKTDALTNCFFWMRKGKKSWSLKWWTILHPEVAQSGFFTMEQMKSLKLH